MGSQVNGGSIGLRQPGVILALLWVVSACASSAAPLLVPKPGDVTSIDATISNSYNPDTQNYRAAVHVQDPKKITQILQQISALNSGMTIPPGTFPTPTHTIVVIDRNNINLVVFIGLDWIGGRNNIPGAASRNRARRISDAERASLLRLVGIDDYRFK